MEFKAAKCPNCGGELQLPDNRETVKCMYCGGEVVVQKAIRDYAPQVNIDNLLELADKALAAGNLPEAKAYYTRILEVEPKNYKAWFGKGKSTSFHASYDKFDLSEMISYFNTAFENSPEDLTTELKRRAGIVIDRVCSMYANTYVKESAKEQGSTFLTLWAQFRRQLQEMITYYLYAITLAPTELAIYENAIFFLKTSLNRNESDEYYDEKNKIIDVMIKFAVTNNPSELIDGNEAFSKIDPAMYQDKETSSDLIKDPFKLPCYIATAVYGDFNAPAVLTLRHYRDEVLMNTKLGRLFVRYYYSLSPRVVRWMEGKTTINQWVKRILDKMVQAIESRYRP